nr:MBL fold metallo-hydrolase [Telluria mixta]
MPELCRRGPGGGNPAATKPRSGRPKRGIIGPKPPSARQTMEFQFLGTSSGTPSKTRNVSGLALRGPGGGWSLVDCGEGTQHRILHTTLSLHDLRAIFITHLHGDHCYGLPGLLASAGMLNRTAPLALVGPPALRTFIDGVMATSELGLPYPLDFIAVDDLAIRPIFPSCPTWPWTPSRCRTACPPGPTASRNARWSASWTPPACARPASHRARPGAHCSTASMPCWTTAAYCMPPTGCWRRARRARSSWAATTTRPACCWRRRARPTC